MPVSWHAGILESDLISAPFIDLSSEHSERYAPLAAFHGEHVRFAEAEAFGSASSAVMVPASVSCGRPSHNRITRWWPGR